MSTTRLEAKLFRLLVIFTAALEVGAAGTMAYSGNNETRLVGIVREAYARHDDAKRECTSRNDGVSCVGPAQRFVDYTLDWTTPARRKNQELGDAAVIAFFAGPSLYLAFLLIRFALSGKWRPLWPWRLEQPAETL